MNLLTSCPEGKVKVQNMIPYDLSAGKRSEEPPLLRPTGTEPRPGTSFGISPDLLPNLANSREEMEFLVTYCQTGKVKELQIILYDLLPKGKVRGFSPHIVPVGGVWGVVYTLDKLPASDH